MHESIKLLGCGVKDKVTGFSGIVTTVSFDLYGCIQAVVTPSSTDKENSYSGRWFDTKRLELVSREPVMEVPTFEAVAGPASLPAFRADPSER